MYNDKYASEVVKKDVDKLLFQLIDISRMFSLDTVNIYQLIFILYSVSKNDIKVNDEYNDYYSFLIDLKEKLDIKDLNSNEKVIIRESIDNLVSRVNLFSDSKKIINIINQYNYKDYVNLIKFGNLNQFDRISYETPVHLSELANKIFALCDYSSAIDLCCGSGSYLINTKLVNPTVKITGYDINPSSIKINKIKMTMLNYQCELETMDTLLIKTFEQKYDYVFCNAPFMSNYKDLINVNENGNYSFSFRPVNSQIWRFVYKTINLLKKNGKGIVVLPLGPLFKQPDSEIRKELIELGLVETIIELPQGTHFNTAIGSALLVLSNGNSNVKFIDAKDILNNSNKMDVEEIFNLYSCINNSKNAIIKSIGDIANNNYSLLCSNYLNDVKASMINPVLLKDYIEVIRGYQSTINNKELYYNEKYKIVNLSDISEGILNKENLADVQYTPRMDKFLIQDNDLLMTARGSRFECTVARIEDNERLVASSNLLIVRIYNKELNPYYLKLFLDSEIGQKSLFRNQVKSILLSINSANLMDTYIDLIDIYKQETISEKYISMIYLLGEKVNEIKLLKTKLTELIKEV
ncbi:MAG: N-6 DNA methylase [Bacilli bacterium]